MDCRKWYNNGLKEEFSRATTSHWQQASKHTSRHAAASAKLTHFKCQLVLTQHPLIAAKCLPSSLDVLSLEIYYVGVCTCSFCCHQTTKQAGSVHITNEW